MTSTSFLNFETFRLSSIQIFKTFIEKLTKANNGKMFVTSPPKLQNYFFQLFNNEDIFTYKPFPTIVNAENPYTIIAITNGDPENLEMICSKFQDCPRLRKALLVIPKFTERSKIIMENHKLQIVSEASNFHSSQVYVGEFPADFIPIEDDFFLMPSTNCFKNIFINHDTLDLYNSARALAKIQYIYGRIPQVVTVGQQSERIHRLMCGMMDQVELGKAVAPAISSVLIIDRYADLLTPLSIAQPCEQLYNEYYGINYGIIQLGNDLKDLVKLTDNDVIFKDYRYKSLSEAEIYINGIRPQEEEKFKKAKTLSEKKEIFGEFQKKLSQKLDLHVKLFSGLINLIDFRIYNCSSRIPFGMMLREKDTFNYIEKLLATLGDWQTALRLIIIYQLIGYKKGVTRIYSSIQKEILAEFGQKSLEGIMNLDVLKLISSEPFGWDFSSILTKLNLINKDSNSDIQQAMYMYFPISVSLAKMLADNEIKEVQSLFPESLPHIKMSITGEKPELTTDQMRILVFFTGGVSLGEVAFLKNIGHSVFNDKVQFIIGATNTVDGNGLIKEICPFLK